MNSKSPPHPSSTSPSYSSSSSSALPLPLPLPSPSSLTYRPLLSSSLSFTYDWSRIYSPLNFNFSEEIFTQNDKIQNEIQNHNENIINLQKREKEEKNNEYSDSSMGMDMESKESSSSPSPLSLFSSPYCPLFPPSPFHSHPLPPPLYSNGNIDFPLHWDFRHVVSDSVLPINAENDHQKCGNDVLTTRKDIINHVDQTWKERKKEIDEWKTKKEQILKERNGHYSNSLALSFNPSSSLSLHSSSYTPPPPSSSPSSSSSLSYLPSPPLSSWSAVISDCVSHAKNFHSFHSSRRSAAHHISLHCRVSLLRSFLQHTGFSHPVKMSERARLQNAPPPVSNTSFLTAVTHSNYIVRAKRQTIELSLYWKKKEKEVSEQRKRMEKESEEQRKREMETKEAERQKRKLEFLLTQTELYSHFIGTKMGIGGIDSKASASASNEISAGIMTEAQAAATSLLQSTAKKTNFFDSEYQKTKEKTQMKMIDDNDVEDDEDDEDEEKEREKEEKEKESLENAMSIDSSSPPIDISLSSPASSISASSISSLVSSSFVGSLKQYQLRGLQWMLNLYDQGINGILADEMGLGKTIQTIAFLCHLSEVRNLWGPFLIIAPNSTLHQWCAEIKKFGPHLNVLPYWGSGADRTAIRRYAFASNKLYSQSSPFHVLVTSYQLAVTDNRYLNRLKWQYSIYDEAHALKNSATQRWKALLSLKCRNRILLTGTPIQNSMRELWALLHFIMPEFFDSHEEFNEWFSKEIEGQAEAEEGVRLDSKSMTMTKKEKGQASQAQKFALVSRQIRRLHLILRPFMLRRIKKDVENEMPPKTELLINCQLSKRQKHFYHILQSKVRSRGAESLKRSVGEQKGESSTTLTKDSLLNLFMQFRKLCNSPSLLDPRSIVTPYRFISSSLTNSVSIYNKFTNITIQSISSHPSRIHNNSPITFRLPKLCRFNIIPEWSNQSHLKKKLISKYFTILAPTLSADRSPTLSFLSLIGLSPAEIYFAFRSSPLLSHIIFTHYFNFKLNDYSTQNRHTMLTHPFIENKLKLKFLDSIPSLSPLPNKLFSYENPLKGAIQFVSKSGFNPLMVEKKKKEEEEKEKEKKASATATATAIATAAPMLLSSSSSQYSPMDVEMKDSTSFSSTLNRTNSSSSPSSPSPLFDNPLVNTTLYREIVPFSLLHEFYRSDTFSSFISHHRKLVSTLSFVIPNVTAPSIYPQYTAFTPEVIKYDDEWPKYERLETRIIKKSVISQREIELFLPVEMRIPISLTDMEPSSAHVIQSFHHSLNLYPPSFASLNPLRSVTVPSFHRSVSDSCKLQMLDYLLRECQANGHKVLIFTQMTRVLNLLEEFLRYRRWKYFRLDGQTLLADRRDRVQKFQSPNSDIFCFILSTRAGGLGINLTAADTVIFFDSDYNNTSDMQATDRVHRIGQKKPVTIYRLICKKTVEERILSRARVKANIQQTVYSGKYNMESNTGNEEGEEGNERNKMDLQESQISGLMSGTNSARELEMMIREEVEEEIEENENDEEENEEKGEGGKGKTYDPLNLSEEAVEVDEEDTFFKSLTKGDGDDTFGDDDGEGEGGKKKSKSKDKEREKDKGSKKDKKKEKEGESSKKSKKKEKSSSSSSSVSKRKLPDSSPIDHTSNSMGHENNDNNHRPVGEQEESSKRTKVDEM